MVDDPTISGGEGVTPSSPPGGEGPEGGGTPQVDVNDPAVKAVIDAQLKEQRDALEAAKTEYSEAVQELQPYRSMLNSAEGQALLDAHQNKQRVRVVPEGQREQGGGSPDQGFQQFYERLQNEIQEEGGADPALAKHITRGMMGANFEVVKFLRQALDEQKQAFQQELGKVTGEFGKYRDSRAFQDLAHENPTISGVPYRNIPSEVIAEARKLRDRVEGLTPADSVEWALGKVGGKRYVDVLTKEKESSDAAVGLPSVGGPGAEFVSRAVDGKNLSSARSLADMERMYEEALSGT